MQRAFSYVFCVRKTHEVGLHSIRFLYLFCTYGKRIRFFYVRIVVYANSMRTSVFFVVRTKAHPQILRTHQVEHSSTFVHFRTYQ